MNDLRTAAQQALEALEYHVAPPSAPTWRTTAAITALRAALAQEQAGSWQDGVLEGHLRERERWLAQEQAEPKGGGRLPPPLQAEPVQEPDLSRCPQCNGPADNGHDRSIPPNPYLCTKCMAEPEPCPNCASLEAQNSELDRKLAEVEQEEREACAKVCDDIEEAYQRQESMRHPALRTDAETGSGECAAAIRARGNT